MGFTPMAYSGLETGERNVVSHAVRQNDVSSPGYIAVKTSYIFTLFSWLIGQDCGCGVWIGMGEGGWVGVRGGG